jgi:hypothetical protein
VGDGDELRSRAEQLLVLIEQEFAAIIDRHHPQDRALLLAEDLPRHDIGVVFHGGDNDLIPGLEMLSAVAVDHEVDSLGDTAHEDDLALG